MADEKTLGWGAALVWAIRRPTALFEAAAQGRVSANPIWTYWLATAALFGALVLALPGGPTPQLALLWAVFSLVYAPISWFMDRAFTYMGARLLGGKGSLLASGAVVGWSAVPNLLAPIPVLGFAAQLWSLVCRVIGLRVVHQLGVVRAIAASTLALASPVITAIFLRVFVLEAFLIPSGSMFPSLEVGDHLFVAKAAYQLPARHMPERADVIVFEYPGDPKVEYVKRVIGLPGDVLSFSTQGVTINGWQVPRCSLGKANVTREDENNSFDVSVEFLNGHAYLVADQPFHDQGPYEVQPGELFVVGDNRQNSADSRIWNEGRGAGLPLSLVVGKVWVLWFPQERFGQRVHDAPRLPAELTRLSPQLAECLAKAPDVAHSTPPRSQR